MGGTPHEYASGPAGELLGGVGNGGAGVPADCPAAWAEESLDVSTMPATLHRATLRTNDTGYIRLARVHMASLLRERASFVGAGPVARRIIARIHLVQPGVIAPSQQLDARGPAAYERREISGVLSPEVAARYAWSDGHGVGEESSRRSIA
jgi:hypothetical protein